MVTLVCHMYAIHLENKIRSTREHIYARIHHSNMFCLVHMVPEYQECALVVNQAWEWISEK